MAERVARAEKVAAATAMRGASSAAEVDTLERLVKAHRIVGTRRRTAVAKNLPRHKGGRFLRDPLPMQTLRDGEIFEQVRRMLPRDEISAVTLTKNFASGRHVDNVWRSHTMLLGDFNTTDLYL